MVRYDTYCDTGITIRYASRYIYYPLIYEMQNCVIEVLIRIYYNIWGNTYHNTIFSLAIRIVGAVYRYFVIHWWIVTSLLYANNDIGHQRLHGHKCHDSIADRSCAKFVAITSLKFGCSMMANWNFDQIWIAMEKLLVKWVPEMADATQGAASVLE